MPIFVQRAQHQRIHTLGMDSLYVSVHTSFRHGSNRLSYMVLAGLYLDKRKKVSLSDKKTEDFCR
nr:MAG TPA: hypothetical protein [Caudoviricetes sp.]